jgi:hypothetical protein
MWFTWPHYKKGREEGRRGRKKREEKRGRREGERKKKMQLDLLFNFYYKYLNP